MNPMHGNNDPFNPSNLGSNPSDRKLFALGNTYFSLRSLLCLRFLKDGEIDIRMLQVP